MADEMEKHCHEAKEVRVLGFAVGSPSSLKARSPAAFRLASGNCAPTAFGSAESWSGGGQHAATDAPGKPWRYEHSGAPPLRYEATSSLID